MTTTPRKPARPPPRPSAGSDGVLEALATGLPSLGSPVAPTVAALAERLYRWWNALPQHALDPREMPTPAQTVRTTLRKATEPPRLLPAALPLASGSELGLPSCWARECQSI